MKVIVITYGTNEGSYGLNIIKVGALFGSYYGSYNSGNTNISNVYWNTETSGQLTASGEGEGEVQVGIGLTDAQMKQADSFSGFDISAQGGTESIWRIYEGSTNPFLRSFLTQVDISALDKTTTYNVKNQNVNSIGNKYQSVILFPGFYFGLFHKLIYVFEAD